MTEIVRFPTPPRLCSIALSLGLERRSWLSAFAQSSERIGRTMKEAEKIRRKMTSNAPSRFEDVVAELREQGLTIKVDSTFNETWYIKGEDMYCGYIMTGEELLELKKANKLNLAGVKSLG